MPEYDFAKLFDGKESLTLEELKEALGDAKLADLATGEYVSKGKYDDAMKAAAKKQAELAAKVEELTQAAEEPKSQVEKLAAEIEALKKSHEDATQRATRLEREKAVSAKVSDPKLAKLALIEAEALMDDDTDFEAALAKLIESDPDYTAERETEEPGTRFVTGVPTKGRPSGTPIDEAVKAAEKAAGLSDE